jgi:peptidoglycan/LPS O-acetylase OafA/YrhL
MVINHKAQRYYALDSLRFFAAFVVFVRHARVIFGIELPQLHWFFKGLLSDQAAVCFFFVLSGFVLHASLLKTGFSYNKYIAFVIRRLFRIYPLYYFSLALCLLVVWFVIAGPDLSVSDYAQRVLDADHGDVGQWFHHALLISPKINMYFLNPPTWTLSVEARVALVFPFISFALTRVGLWGGAILLAALYPACWFIGAHTFGTIELIPLFAIGAFAAQHKEKIYIPSAPGLVCGLIVISLCAYGAPSHVALTAIHPTLGYWVSSLGACMIMLIVISTSVIRSTLENKTLILLGNLSYGIYILHYAFLLMTSSLLGRHWLGSKSVACIVAILATMILAFVCHYLIERPFIRLGGKIANKFSSSVS